MTQLIPVPWRAPTAAAPRDPLTIGITIISAVEAASGLAIGFEVASFVGAAVITGASIGAQMLLAQRPDGGGGIDPFSGGSINAQEIRVNSRHPTPTKRIVYGSALSGGSMYFEQVKAPYLYHGWLLAAHEIEGIVEVRIGRHVMVFSTVEELLPDGILTPIGRRDDDGSVSATPDYPGNLQVSVRKGTSTQARDALLAAGFSSLASSFRQRGIATAALRYRYPGTTYNDFQDMWGNVQAPNPLFLIKGRKLYDPRDPTQIMWSDPRDLDEVAAAEATWRWSNNAALVQADYMVQPFGGRISPGKVDYDKVADAAAYDDELVGTTTEGEFIKRHTIDGVVTLNQSPNEVLRNMLSANRGFVLQRAGRVWVSSSRPQTSVLTIHDGLLSGGFEFQGHKAKRDLLNRLHSRFVSTEQDYQEVDGPTLDRVDLQTDDQEILGATLSLPFTLDYRRVERLQKAYLASARLGKTLTLRLSLRALAIASDELIGAAVTVESELFPVINGSYRVLGMGFAETFASLELQLAEYDASIETDWIPADDEVAFSVEELDLS